MSSITTGNAEQYANSKRLAARGRLYSHYSTAETPWFSWVTQRLPFKANDHILDIGCGAGWFWATATQTMPHDIDLTLADQSAGMVAEAEERCRLLPFAAVHGVQADAMRMPFADESFDGVVAMHMFYHLADQAAAAAEMFRVLKPGGWLAVTANGVGNMREIYSLTTVLGSPPIDPSAAVFGFDVAERLLRAQFGNVEVAVHPSGLHVTDSEDVFLALTSYPPGDRASEAELAAFRAAIAEAFERGNGALEVKNEVGLFFCRKSGG